MITKLISVFKGMIRSVLSWLIHLRWTISQLGLTVSLISSEEERMLGHMGHEEIDKSIEKVIWSFKYPIHDSEKFDVPCESMIFEFRLYLNQYVFQ